MHQSRFWAPSCGTAVTFLANAHEFGELMGSAYGSVFLYRTIQRWLSDRIQAAGILNRNDGNDELIARVTAPGYGAAA